MKLLLTSLGRPKSGKYDTSEYILGESSLRTSFAPLAVNRLVGPFDSILVVATDVASQLMDELKQEAPNPAIIEHVAIPEPRDEEQIEGVVSKLIDEVVERHDTNEPLHVVLDVTLAFRSLPLLYFAAMTFLVEFAGVTIDDVVYAHRIDDNKYEIVRLGSAYELVRWAYATKMFKEQGTTHYLHEILKEKQARQFTSGRGNRTLASVQSSLNGFGRIAATTLSLDIGSCAYDVTKYLDLWNEEVGSHAPVFSKLIGEIRETVVRLATSTENPYKAPLSKEEIERELRVIEWALERGHLVAAAEMIVETFINDLLLAYAPDAWLTLNIRERARRILGIIVERNKDPVTRRGIPEEVRAAAEAFDIVRQRRNAVAHCGYKDEGIRLKDFEAEVRKAIETIRKNPDWASYLEKAGRGVRLLVSPLGESVGVLYTAIKKTNPDKILVIVSERTEGKVSVPLEKAGFNGEVETIRVDDPHGGFDQLSSLAKSSESILAAIGAVTVNITGGTTLMGEVARAVGSECRRLGVPYCVVAVADRRPREEQLEEPFVEGEIYVLEVDNPYDTEAPNEDLIWWWAP